MTKNIEEKASNYMRGRAMALSFKPLSLADIKEAYLCGAEDYAHSENSEPPTNPRHKAIGTCNSDKNLQENASLWHKASAELPEEDGTYLLRFWAGCSFQIFIGSYRNGKFGALTMEDGDYVTHWMEIPELPKED